MNFKQFAIALLLFSPVAFSAPTELGVLVKQVLAAQSEGTLPWSFLASSGSPVSWQTEGVDSDGKRTGAILVSVGGFIPQVLRQNVEPAPWSITLTGDKFGARVVGLSNDGCFGTNATSERCGERLANIGPSLSQAGLTVTPACEFGQGGEHTKLFTVGTKNARPLFLALSESSGSGGVTVDITLFIHSRNGASNLEHATSICSILFAQGSGKDSNNFYSYSYLYSKQRASPPNQALQPTPQPPLR